MRVGLNKYSTSYSTLFSRGEVCIITRNMSRAFPTVEIITNRGQTEGLGEKGSVSCSQGARRRRSARKPRCSVCSGLLVEPLSIISLYKERIDDRQMTRRQRCPQLIMSHNVSRDVVLVHLACPHFPDELLSPQFDILVSD